MIAYMIYIDNPGYPAYLHMIQYDSNEVAEYVEHIRSRDYNVVVEELWIPVDIIVNDERYLHWCKGHDEWQGGD